MVFSPSPALHRIRQLMRLIRKHPDLPGKPRNALRRVPKLPDPEQFVDSSAVRNDVPGRTKLNSGRKRVACPGKPVR
jgi:hypothetical protein